MPIVSSSPMGVLSRSRRRPTAVIGLADARAILAIAAASSARAVASRSAAASSNGDFVGVGAAYAGSAASGLSPSRPCASASASSAIRRSCSIINCIDAMRDCTVRRSAIRPVPPAASRTSTLRSTASSRASCVSRRRMRAVGAFRLSNRHRGVRGHFTHHRGIVGIGHRNPGTGPVAIRLALAALGQRLPDIQFVHRAALAHRAVHPGRHPFHLRIRETSRRVRPLPCGQGSTRTRRRAPEIEQRRSAGRTARHHCSQPRPSARRRTASAIAAVNIDPRMESSSLVLINCGPAQRVYSWPRQHRFWPSAPPELS